MGWGKAVGQETPVSRMQQRSNRWDNMGDSRGDHNNDMWRKTCQYNNFWDRCMSESARRRCANCDSDNDSGRLITSHSRTQSDVSRERGEGRGQPVHHCSGGDCQTRHSLQETEDTECQCPAPQLTPNPGGSGRRTRLPNGQNQGISQARGARIPWRRCQRWWTLNNNT